VRARLPKATTKQGELTNNFIAGGVGGTFGTLINTPFVCLFGVIDCRMWSSRGSRIRRDNMVLCRNIIGRILRWRWSQEKKVSQHYIKALSPK
jgi:hypothetical protein